MTMMDYGFMKNALLAVLLITPMFAILGTMVVHKRMAYFSDALGHSALTGIAVGVLFGFRDATVSMVIFGIVFALVLNQIKFRNLLSADTVISVFASFSMAVGLAVLSKGGSFSNYSAMLVGDILSITVPEIIGLLVILVFTVIFWIFAVNSLNAISVSPVLARSRHMKVNLMENVFAVLIAVIVMLSIKWVGILLISALLILPAAASRNIAENMREYHIYALIFSVFSGVVGLISSYFANVATGPMIAVVASVIFFGTYFKGKQ
ncbi:MAG: metal ABC transporter permease [Lachnospiraceae bacterium]|nr:metal ABC transporter permease [Lachnospiraceae bacterium]